MDGERHHCGVDGRRHGAKPESLWWTNTHKGEDEKDAEIGKQSEKLGCAFAEPFDLLCCRFRRTGRGIQRTEKTLSKGMGSWWRDGFIHQRKSVSSSRKCDRVFSHLFSTALDGSVKRPWKYKKRVLRVKRWESKILRLTFRPRMKAGEDRVEYRKRTSWEMKAKWRKMNYRRWPRRTLRRCGRPWSGPISDGDVSVMKALRSILGHACAPYERFKVETSVRGYHNRGVV